MPLYGISWTKCTDSAVLIIVDRDGTCVRANSLPGMLTENGELRVQTT